MVNLSGRSLALVAAVCFAAGTVFGYQLKTWRFEYLKRRRRRLVDKLDDVQRKIELELNKAIL